MLDVSQISNHRKYIFSFSCSDGTLKRQACRRCIQITDNKMTQKRSTHIKNEVELLISVWGKLSKFMENGSALVKPSMCRNFTTCLWLCDSSSVWKVCNCPEYISVLHDCRNLDARIIGS
jgi:hypothetical protein